MAISFVTDLHFGSTSTIDNQILTLRSVRDETLKTNSNKILILGDIFHNRTSINILVLNKVLDFFDEVDSRKIEWTILVGNHDMYHKDSNTINSLVVLKPYNNIQVISDIQVVKIDGYNILAVPFIFNEDEAIKTINEHLTNNKIDFIVSHLETPNFKMTKNYVSKHGLDLSKLKINNNTPVLSGHYHNKQKNKNVLFIGSLNQENFNCYGEDKGYTVLADNLTNVAIDDFVFNSMIHSMMIHTIIKIIKDESIKILIQNGIDEDIEMIGTEKQLIKQLDEYLKPKLLSVKVVVHQNIAQIKRLIKHIESNVIKCVLDFRKEDELQSTENEVTLVSGSNKDITTVLYETLSTDEEKLMLTSLLDEAD